MINPDCALNTGPRGLGNKEHEGTLRFKLLLADTHLGMSAFKGFSQNNSFRFPNESVTSDFVKKHYSPQACEPQTPRCPGGPGIDAFPCAGKKSG